MHLYRPPPARSRIPNRAPPQIERLRADLDADLYAPDAALRRGLTPNLRDSWHGKTWAHDRDEDEDLAQGTLESGSFARRRWGIRDTLYFHLMTGRFADQARAVGDVFALLPSVGLRRRFKALRSKAKPSRNDE